MVQKKNKFLALIIPEKDVEKFFMSHKKEFKDICHIAELYADYRQKTGRNRINKYIIINQDEPYAEKVWKIVLEGESKKEAKK